MSNAEREAPPSSTCSSVEAYIVAHQEQKEKEIDHQESIEESDPVERETEETKIAEVEEVELEVEVEEEKNVNNLVEVDEEIEVKPQMEIGMEVEEEKTILLDKEEQEEFLLSQAKLKEEMEEEKQKAELQGQVSAQNRAPVVKRESFMNIDSLLRLFKSDYFKPWISINYLFKYTKDGVHDYLSNQMYNMADSDVEFFLIELCTMMVHSRFTSDALERFIMDKCKHSVHLALQINWLLFSSTNGSHAVSRCAEELQSKCEISTVNGTLAQTQVSSLLVADHCDVSASDLSAMHSAGTLHEYNSKSSPNLIQIEDDEESKKEERKQEKRKLSHSGDSITLEALEKMDRCDYFYQILHFVEGLGQLSDKLRSVPVSERQKALVALMVEQNENLHSGIYLPLWQADSPHYCIVRIAAEHSISLKSRERVPFILLFEAIQCEDVSSSPTIHKVAKACHEKIEAIKKQNEAKKNVVEREGGVEIVQEEEQEMMSEEEQENAAVPLKVHSPKPPKALDSEPYKNSPFGEPFAKKQERLRKESPFGHLEGWHLRSVIIKYGDDCKQEYLALQLISQFQKIFREANLPLYLRPYKILVNSPDSGIIETITDAISIDGLKKFYSREERVSLKDHFLSFYDDPAGRPYQLAVRNFVESLAGYSIVAYLLQIKDRHNGNILIDAEGHLVHIDFGFLLTNSPGSINAENVPFKFTQEYMELMGGRESPMFSYFTGLLRCGYLEVRKHYETILSLVEIMSIDETLPCFASGHNALEALTERFNIRMTEKEIDEFLSNMVEQSYDCWRTRYYDHFQYLTNKILY